MNIIDIILNFQANVELNVPREHHKFILGKGGKTLQTLELQTATKITMPRDGSDTIRIVGTKEGVDSARHEIQIISDEQVSCKEIISVGWSGVKETQVWQLFGWPNTALQGIAAVRDRIVDTLAFSSPPMI